MAITKAAHQFIASAALAAGASADSGWDSLLSYYETTVGLKVVNGGSAPTSPCEVIIEVSQDAAGTDSYEWFRAKAGVSASATYDFNVILPASIMYAKVTFDHTAEATNGVTVESEGMALTGI